jgi:cell division protein FtsB
MKIFVLFLVAVFLLLQYQLWLDQDGVRKVVHLSHSVKEKQEANRALYERNEVLAAEVEDLKTGYDAIEERARMELGMIREGETFIQVIEPSAEISK